MPASKTTLAISPPSFMSNSTSYPDNDNPLMVPPDCFLNCNAVPPTVETAVMFSKVGLALSLSPSNTVEKPATVLEMYTFSTPPFHSSVQSIESSSLFSKYKLVTDTVPPKNSTPSSAPLITAKLFTTVPDPTA